MATQITGPYTQAQSLRKAVPVRPEAGYCPFNRQWRKAVSPECHNLSFCTCKHWMMDRVQKLNVVEYYNIYSKLVTP